MATLGPSFGYDHSSGNGYLNGVDGQYAGDYRSGNPDFYAYVDHAANEAQIDAARTLRRMEAAQQQDRRDAEARRLGYESEAHMQQVLYGRYIDDLTARAEAGDTEAEYQLNKEVIKRAYLFYRTTILLVAGIVGFLALWAYFAVTG